MRQRIHDVITLLAAAVLALAPATVDGSPGAAPDPTAIAQLDGFALGLAAADRFSGVVLVAHGNRVLLEKAYGPADPERDQAATAGTRYNLASASKMFTSVAILQQIAAGRLSLETRVGEVLRDYPNRAFADTVTVRHLLTHMAGAGGIDLFGVENAANRARARSVAEMVALHHHRPPSFPPGSRQDYDNFGYVVLGRIVEILSGESYEDYVARRILAPAGMARTGFIDCAPGASDLAVGYVTLDGRRRPNCATQPLRGFPAGGAVATARDMFLFIRALRSGRLIPPALLAEATRPHHQFMGLGFFATDYGPGYDARDFRWGHGGGGSEGMCTDVRFYPETDETIIVLSNHDGPGCFEVANFLHRQWSAAQERERRR